MKKYVLVIGVFFLFFFSFSSPSFALLSQSINPDESWLTIYQDIDRAWVAEKVSLSLHQGENRFFLTGDNLLQERFYFHPYDPSTTLKAMSTTPTNGYQIEIEAQQSGSYAFLLSFFMSGLNWKEHYMAIWDEKNSNFYLYPSVFLSNRKNINWKNIHVSWLLGKPAFLFDGDKGGISEDEALGAAKGIQPQVMMAREKPVVMERVSEYQVFHLPYIVDLPAQSVLQVFPGMRKFPITEIIRVEKGNLKRILKMKSVGDPLPQGWVTIFGENQSVLGTFQFPLVRTQEEFEITVGTIKTLQIERIEKSYKRLKVDLNEERNIAGFWSEIIIEFELINRGNISKPVEIIEPLPVDAKLTGSEDWRWEDGNAHLEITIEPDQREKVTLKYEFREVWS
ncbi:MAG: DUF4139 domain-containing protein [Candidatus Atribacteria bacterium]|nr:DUF4139 domain-containing protein [Candidatus Atribacteria bacterium]